MVSKPHSEIDAMSHNQEAYWVVLNIGAANLNTFCFGSAHAVGSANAVGVSLTVYLCTGNMIDDTAPAYRYEIRASASPSSE